MSLNAGIYNSKITDIVAAFEDSTLLDMQMGTGLEEKRTAKESALGNNDYTTAVGRRFIDNRLNSFGLKQIAIIGRNPIIGDAVSFAQLGNIDWSILIKPIGNRCSVRKFLFGRYIQAQKQRDKQKNLFHGFSFLINIQCILRFRKPEQIRMVGHTLPQTDLSTKIRTSQHNRQISCRKNI